MSGRQVISQVLRRPVGIFLVFQLLGPPTAFLSAYCYAVSPLLTDPMGDPLPTFGKVTAMFFLTPVTLGLTYFYAGIPAGLAGACFAIYFRLFGYLPFWPVILFFMAMLYLIWNSVSDHGAKAFAIDVPIFGVSATMVLVCWTVCWILGVGRNPLEHRL